MEGQKISSFPIKRLKPSPAFPYIANDYFGPFIIKGNIQKPPRSKFNCLPSQPTRSKVYGTILTIINS